MLSVVIKGTSMRCAELNLLLPEICRRKVSKSLDGLAIFHIPVAIDICCGYLSSAVNI
jgi:hypothetical protein